MSNIQEYLAKILSARYGKDVRQSIHDSIQEINTVAETAEANSATAKDSALASAELALTSATLAGESEESAREYAALAKSYSDNAEAVTGITVATEERAGISKPDGITLKIGTDGTMSVNREVICSNEYAESLVSNKATNDYVNQEISEAKQYTDTKSAGKADSMEYNEDTSMLLLKSGDTILSSVEISGGGGATTMIHVTTTEETWINNESVTVEIHDDTKVYSGYFDASGRYSHKVQTLGAHLVKVTDGAEVFESTVDVTQLGAVYNVTIDKITWGYKGWLQSANISTSGFNSLEDVFASEVTVRELMTKHSSSDYLCDWFAEIPSDRATFWASDVAMKWIGLRDYICDKLMALYESEMLASEHWQRILKDHVPTMTSDTAPYGTASAYKVFDGSASTSVSGTDFSYKFENPICIKRFESSVDGGELQVSGNGSTWYANDGGYHLYARVHYSASKTVHTVQFYGRELSIGIPKMTSNTSPMGNASASNEGEYHAWKAFDKSTPTYWGTGSGTGVGTWLKYEFNNAFVPKIFTGGFAGNRRIVALEGSNDNQTWDELIDNTYTAGPNGDWVLSINTTNAYKYYRQRVIEGNGYQWGIQCYEFNVWGIDYSEREFTEGSTMKYLYDHGVELEPMTVESTSALATVDVTSYSLLRATDVDHAQTTDKLTCGSAYATVNGLPNNNYLDISSVNGSNQVGWGTKNTTYLNETSLWLE